MVVLALTRAMMRWSVPLHLPWGMARPLPMPVVRVVSRSRTASRTFLASWTSPLVARRSTSSLMASVLALASRPSLMLAGLSISDKRMMHDSAGASDGGPSRTLSVNAPPRGEGARKAKILLRWRGGGNTTASADPGLREYAQSPAWTEVHRSGVSGACVVGRFGVINDAITPPAR